MSFLNPYKDKSIEELESIISEKITATFSGMDPSEVDELLKHYKASIALKMFEENIIGSLESVYYCKEPFGESFITPKKEIAEDWKSSDEGTRRVTEVRVANWRK